MLAVAGGLTLAFVIFAPHEKNYASVPSPFIYSFNVDGVLEEAATPEESKSPYFWLNSGGRLRISNHTGSTLFGNLSETDQWYRAYQASDPEDTKNGAQPQNIFRLLTRSAWEQVRISEDFYIERDNFLPSSNRNASNGILFMMRHVDSDNLYYAGVRVDGTAVIKKKVEGVYYTMAQAAAFEGTYVGSQDDTSLLPQRQWFSLQSEAITNSDSSVTVRLYLRRSLEDSWELLLEATDTGNYAQTEPLRAKAPVGLRTDFMDVQFKNLRIEEL